MTRTRGTHVQTELASYSRDFYRDLAALSGVDVGYYPNGSLSLARTPERLTELRYALTLARHHGLPARELSLDEIAAVSPLLSVDGPGRRRALRGGRHGQPRLGRLRDGQGRPRPRRARGRGRARHRLPPGDDRARPRARDRRRDRPRRRGVRGRRHRRRAVDARPRRCSPARASRCTRRSTTGRRRSRSRAPPATCRSSATWTARSTCATTAAVCSSARSSRTGGRAPTASIPQDFAFGEFEPDLEHFGRPLARARERVPALESARFAHYLCAPESFTPDGNFLLGETAEVAGLFVAAGMNSQGIILGPGRRTRAGGVDRRGRADGWTRPTWTSAASRRPRPTRATSSSARASRWAGSTPCTGRSCSRARPADCGACRCTTASPRPAPCFGEAAGWERADWYAPPGRAAGVRVLLRPPELVRRGRRGAPRRPRGASRSSTSPRSPSCAWRAPEPLAARAARLHRRPRPPARLRRLHLDAQRARRRRARRDGHAPGRGRVPRRHLGDGADQGVPLAAPPRRPGGRDRRHLRARRALGDRPALARAARGPHGRRR